MTYAQNERQRTLLLPLLGGLAGQGGCPFFRPIFLLPLYHTGVVSWYTGAAA